MAEIDLRGLMMALLFVLICVVVIITLVAIIKKPSSVYQNKPEEQNPMQGKMVRFVENKNEPENADGVKGHLEEIGLSVHHADVYEGMIKRCFDVILSLGTLIVLFPVFLFISLWIVIDDPGPILFTQKRIGKDKQYFKLHKFRSMKMSTPHDRPTHMLENPEQYITNAGKFLRKHSLDELPQIWDIFIGNMSVIGPRPGLWNQDDLIAERDKYGANDVRPGLTGWAQINGRDELKIDVKAKLDGDYVKVLNEGGWKAFMMDMRCFLGTAISAFRGDGVVEGGTGELKKRKNEKKQP